MLPSNLGSARTWGLGGGRSIRRKYVDYGNSVIDSGGGIKRAVRQRSYFFVSKDIRTYRPSSTNGTPFALLFQERWAYGK